MTIFLTVAIVLLLGLILYQFTQIDALWTELQNEKELRNAGVFGAHRIIANLSISVDKSFTRMAQCENLVRQARFDTCNGLTQIHVTIGELATLTNELIGLMRGIGARITELEKTISNSAGLKEFKP